MRKFLKGLIALFDSSDDPVKHCNVYKTVGCAHVDGMHCDMKTCTISDTVVVTPRGFHESRFSTRDEARPPTVVTRENLMDLAMDRGILLTCPSCKGSGRGQHGNDDACCLCRGIGLVKK